MADARHEAFSRILEQVFDVTNTLGRSDLFWRGHSCSSYKLIPKVFREGRKDYDEFNFIQNFERHAPVRYPNWPQERDRRLMLMQHFGLATRLLDWTLSLTAALWFAVQDLDKDNQEGSLWALNPNRLNHAQQEDSNVLITEDPSIKDAIDDAYSRAKEEATDLDKVLAFTGPQIDLRMLTQMACFTIHYRSSPPVEEIPGHENFLREVKIPGKDKCLLRNVLGILGTTEANLFPDLQTLASYTEGSTKFYSLKNNNS